MKRLVISSGIIMAACISLLAAGMNPTIYATGEGIVSVLADTATIIVSVSSSTGNMSRDQIAVQEMMTRVIDALKAAGVAEEEIMPGQSSGISSFQSSSKICRRINNSTICDNSSQQATALERSAVIKLNYTDEARIDNLLDAAESAGAEAYVAGYGLSDPSDAAARAREKAVANARANAADIAAAEGLRLGQVVDISDYGFPAAVYDGLSGSAQSGMVDVTSYVLVTYELEV